jgi:gamma-glutamylcyclotransferase (GGCT)/AIG2-like uncharacterized protein YtfP
LTPVPLEPGLLYFAYGCNMNADVLSRVVGARVTRGSPACADGWRLGFNKGGEGETGATVTATIVRTAGCRVYGVVYRLGLAALRALDAFEGAPEHYERQPIWVAPVGRRAAQAAITYVARPEWVSVSGRPDPDYVQSLLSGARAHGLPDDYVTWLDALARGDIRDCYRLAGEEG